MYSRYHSSKGAPIRVPENYSGCAFSESSQISETMGTSHRIDVAKPTPLNDPPSSHNTPSYGMPSPRPILLPPPKSTPQNPPRTEDGIPHHASAYEMQEGGNTANPPQNDTCQTEKEVEEKRDCESTRTAKEDSSHPSAHSSALPTALLQPLQGLFGNLGHAFPFSHGIGFDELLLIGLIILLSSNGQDHDLILWLALLLFCG